MIKGIQRQTVLLRTPESAYFEEVHFLLRSDRNAESAKDGDMMREANRILEESGLYRNGKKSLREKGSVRSGLLFCLGLLCGGGAMGLLWLLTWLL